MKTSDLKLIKKNGGNAYVSECNDWILIKKPRNKNKRTNYEQVYLKEFLSS